MRLSIPAALSLAFAVFSIPASAQFISVGIKGGVPLTDGFSTLCCSLPSVTTNRYIIGPEVELRLPFHLGVEADALYKHYDVNGSGFSQWEFPILLKYRFKGVPLLHPFADAGAIFNHVSGLPAISGLTANNANSATAGFVLGAGFDFHPVLVHITPEFRYVHWGSPGSASPANPISQNQNQAEFLVGLSF